MGTLVKKRGVLKTSGVRLLRHHAVLAIGIISNHKVVGKQAVDSTSSMSQEFTLLEE